MMVSAPPPPPPSIVIVESAPNRSPLVMMGFSATGSEDSLQKIEAASKTAGLQSARLPGPDASTEVAVAFPPSGSRTVDLSVYHDALNGRFGKLAVEAMVVPLAIYQAGQDIGDAAEAVSPNFLVDPK
jgi:hypothetical protein